ncbi:hypothetical protein EN827_17350 [Mesorhizobium sp. M1D.F.Ca.ET.184.01.1.1]|nr:hypothetical protein EN874_017350 [Mesorhizobium sp. M1D.F.Ca.ET.231.01.1.1]TGP30982.1 hypothetical protein EN877_17355 [Mesorhizobium sp. M1D.F.Ca.ET.234.01.1.1]TGS45285.1 hypothetical protein EN827_17350 [Mesorhizobium sp. M1D.F.Ca.ET.184.01.1.1]TGS60760.1 hypothetical protein EN826_017350 [Mesorhizobium sp. M1D.F.Ca.ET.183.01.1.1]
MAKATVTPDLPPCGGDAWQGRGGRCPADLSAFRIAEPEEDCRGWRSCAPPSVLPDISPTRGEIS